MGFYPVEVLVNDAKRHGVTVLPVDLARSSYKTTTEWVGRPGEPLPDGAGVAARPEPVRSSGCVIPSAESRDRWIPEVTAGWGVRLGLHLVKGIGEQHEALLDGELARGPYASLADVVERTGLGEEVLERLIRTGALDGLGQPRRTLLWQLREVAGPTRGRDGRACRSGGRRQAVRGGRTADGPAPARDRGPGPAAADRVGAAGRLLRGHRARCATAGRRRCSAGRSTSSGRSRTGSSRIGRTGPVRFGGLVVTRQHPMTAKGTVFLALEDETGMVNVTLWPDTWARLRAWSGGTPCCWSTATSSARAPWST